MIARPNLDLLSALAPAAAPLTVPVPLGSGTQNLRFDAALLQAAKTVRDSSGEGVERALMPKVERALESLLNQLAQQPVEQVRQWASQPQLLKPAVEALAQAQGLNSEETAELTHMAPLASKAVVQAYDGFKASAATVVKIATPEPNSGPQGREPGTTQDIAQTFKPQAEVENSATRLNPSTQPQHERETEIPTTLAQAVAWAGIVVSTRTDSGTGADSSLSLSTRPVDAARPTVAATPISVNVSSLQPQASATVPAAVPAVAPVQAPVFAVTGAGVEAAPAQPQASAPVIVRVNSNIKPVTPGTAPVVEGEPEAQTAAPRFRVATANDEVQAPVKAAQAPQRSEAEINLDFKVAAPSKQAPVIQEGTLYVLKGDGSSQGVSQVTVPQAPTSAPVTEKAPLVFAQAPQAAATSSTPAPLQAPVIVAPIQASVPTSTPVTPSIAQPEAQIPASVPVQNAPVQASAPAVVQAQPLAVAQAPMAPVAQPGPAAQPERESAPTVSRDSKTSSSPSFEPSALEQTAGFQALQRSSHEEAPQSNLAFGQETLRNLVNQVARELGIRDAAFTQVSNALAETAAKENSHLVIKLKPGTLGEVQVDLSVEGGKLTAKLLASTAEVRDAFVRDLPAFKASLEAQGLRIDQVSVAVRAESNFNPQGQNQGQQQAPAQTWSPSQPSSQTAPELAGALSTSAWSSPALNDQLFSALA